MNSPVPTATREVSSPTQTLVLPEYLTGALRDLGSDLHAPGVRSKHRPEDDRLLAVSDIGPEGTPFDTFATYLTHLRHAVTLLEDLAEIRQRRRLGNRTMKFDRRTTDGMRQRVLQEWIAAFRARPGVVVVTCWDRNLSQLPGHQPGFDNLAENLTAAGHRTSHSTLERTVRVLAFIPVLAALLDGAHTLEWFTDRDQVMEVDAPRPEGEVAKRFDPRTLTRTAGELLLRTVLLDRAPRLELMTEAEIGRGPSFKRLADDMLSIPDFIAGAVSQALPHPFTTGDLRDTTRKVDADLRDAVTQCVDPSMPGVRAARILAVVFHADLDRSEVQPHAIWLTQEDDDPAGMPE